MLRDPRRVRRMRVGAGMVLVGGLAAAWIATSAPGPAPRPHAAADSADTPVVTGTDAGSSALTRVLPVNARCAERPRSVDEARCSVAGIEVDYRRTSPDAMRSAYLGGAGSAGPRRSGPPACARGGEDERAWSRPSAPRRAVGRYACRIEQGRAVMWWTVDDRGLLAHAVAPDADLASLFAWWESHSER